MDSKIIIAIVAVVAIIGAAGAALVLTKNNGGDVPSDGILYDGNGGKLSDGRTTYVSHSTNVDTCSFEKDGYHWVIWNTKADGSGDNYNENSVAPQKTRLYAQWSNLNTIFGTNDGIQYVSLYVAEKGSSDLVNIDTDYASLPANAVLIAKPQTGVTLKIHVDGKSIIAETAAKNVDMHYSSSIQGISFTNGRIDNNGAAVFDIQQTVSNENAFLGYSSTSGFDVLDVSGTREIPSDIMSVTIGDGVLPGIDINNTGSVECGEEAVIMVTTPVSGQTVHWNQKSEEITVTLPSEIVHTLQFDFKNGGELVSVDEDDNVVTISFTYEKDKDPVFYRLYSHH